MFLGGLPRETAFVVWCLFLYNYIIVWVFGVTVSAALAILSYYVADKMEKKYLDAINKKLSENIDE